MFTNAGAHLIADVAGWYLGTPSVPTQAVPANPDYNPNRAVGVLANKIGLYAGVRVGTNLDVIADAGVAADWADSVNVASPGNVMLFGTARRTEQSSGTSTRSSLATRSA